MINTSIISVVLLLMVTSCLLLESTGTYLDYVHPGKNPNHTFNLGNTFSDEWLGMCVNSLSPVLSDDERLDPDPRHRYGRKRGVDKGSGIRGKDFMSKHGKSLPFEPNAGDKTGLRVLIVSIDNRELKRERRPSNEKGQGGYASLSAAINMDYANFHGYDYLYIAINGTSMRTHLHSRYNCTPDMIETPSFDDPKYGPASYNIGLRYMRASSWNKIPPLYRLAYEYGHLYDWFLYMDSDVTLNPTWVHRSISDVLTEWQDGKTKQFGQNNLPNNNAYVQWGQTNLQKTNMIFLTNFPWRDDMPCAGIFLIRPNKMGLTQLQDWWNFNLPIKNMYDFMEQDALWYMKEACSDDKVNKDGPNNAGDVSNGFDGVTMTVNRRGIINNGHLRDQMKSGMSKIQQWESHQSIYDFAINASTMSMVYEPQMTSPYHGTNDIQFLHMANYVSQKMSYLAVALRNTRGKIDGEMNYKKHMASIIDAHYLSFDVLGLTEQMEDHRKNGVPVPVPVPGAGVAGSSANDDRGIMYFKTRPFSSFPSNYEAKRDDVWHVQTVSLILRPDKRNGIKKNLGQTYNNYVIQCHGDPNLYLIMNGTRHRFPEFDTFVKMGYDLEQVLVFRDRSRREHAQERFIPNGAHILPFDQQRPGYFMEDQEGPMALPSFEFGGSTAETKTAEQKGNERDGDDEGGSQPQPVEEIHSVGAGAEKKKVVPSIVHQTYDYKGPQYFLYLSILTAQHFLRPNRHILYIQNEGRFRAQHWQEWQNNAQPGSWEEKLKKMFDSGLVETKFMTFPNSPPGDASINVQTKAHRSDFLRFSVLGELGGIYLDTDVFCLQSMDELRTHDFVMGLDNVIPPAGGSHRLNNGVMLSAPNATFMRMWEKTYAKGFDPSSFAHHSSEVPFQLAMDHPDLIHVEMNRLSPVSFGLQTSEAAAALTCGILLPDTKGIWYPDHRDGQYTLSGVKADLYLHRQLSSKYVVHLTMSDVKGLSMLRKHIAPEHVDMMPSFLGRAFRMAVHGKDTFDYAPFEAAYAKTQAQGAGVEDSQAQVALAAWDMCRSMLGMGQALESRRPKEDHIRKPTERQQFVSSMLPDHTHLMQ